MTGETNKAIVARFLKLLAEEPDPNVIAQFVSPLAKAEYFPTLLASLIVRAFPDFRAVPQDFIASADSVVCRMKWTGTHRYDFAGIAPSGRVVEGQVVNVFRMAAGKIAEIWQNWDLAGLMQDIGSATAEPILETGDVQGNIVPGFNKDHVCLLFCQIANVREARKWIRRNVSHIATLEEVLAFNRLFKAARNRRGFLEGTIKATWVNIAFSYLGLKKLSPDVDRFSDVAFKEGMHTRSDILGDPSDESAGSPRHWKIGGPGNVPDLVIIVASDDPEDLSAAVRQIYEDQSAGLRLLWRQEGATLPPPLTGHEHFGFLDGISQPGVRGRVSPEPDDFLTDRANPRDQNQGKPGQELRWPGEFIFGYPSEPPAALAEDKNSVAGPDWARNGSFLVFRRYRQDVRGFQEFLASEAAALTRRHTSLAHLTPEKLGAIMMGRWASGAPTLRAWPQDNPQLGRDAYANNNFRFDNPMPRVTGGPGQGNASAYPVPRGDPHGLVCPFAAHIRKANPRDDLKRAGNQGDDGNPHRILRRGIPYTDEKIGERGLLFLCYQASIERQFEFIMKNWVNNPDSRHADEGYDPIVGRTTHPGHARTFEISVQDADGQLSQISITLPVDWTVPTGGGYFFAPSIRALEHLATE